MKKNIIYWFFTVILFISCGSTDVEEDTSGGPINPPPVGENPPEWLLPISEVLDGGPGKDGIPSIDNPIFIEVSNPEVDEFISDNDLIIGIAKGNVAKAYPHYILDWHEIVNDVVDGDLVTISYCPLTGTAFGWRSFSNGSDSTFGGSGLIYNSNLILYDRNTDSNWSQLKVQCVNGSQIEDIPINVDVIETTWGTWKTLYPNTKVLSNETGFPRNYSQYPYGNYKTNHDRFVFPVSPMSSALPNKERIHAILNNNKSKVYEFSNFTNGNAIRDNFNGKEYLIVGNEETIYSFELNISQTNLTFEYDFNNSEIFFKDNENNKWSVFGKAVEGPRMGEKLKVANAVMSYWFAIAAFYPDPIIYAE